MRIGFDAKRVFFNRSGLGVYSRSTVDILAKYAPDNQYVLFSPKRDNPVEYDIPQGVEVVYPGSVWACAPSLWRTYRMGRDIRRSGVDIYHGLSHELPSDIKRAGVKSVITMHDLIFVHHPELYKPVDRKMYTRKYSRSCRDADHIIAVSRQTASDLEELWNIDGSKITVVYQGCSPVFEVRVTEERRRAVKEKYNLPDEYILSVGTIERRKNLMLTVMAMAEGHLDVELVACGRHTPYADEIMAYAAANGIAHRVHMRHSVEFADLPALYQMSNLFVYASLFEGFGIPILEAMNSRIPVITTKGGVFVETGGDACLYVAPTSVEQMINAIERGLSDNALRDGMIERGLAHSRNFTEPTIAKNLIGVYDSLLSR